MTSFNPAATATTPAVPDNVTPTTPPAQPTGFDFEYGGRKFTREELLNKLTHADNHIATLTAERAGDRQALAEATTALQSAIKAAELLKTPTPAPALPATPPVDIASAVDQAVTAREIKAREETNWKAAQNAMTKAYGDKADAKAKEVAESLGMSMEDMVSMARTKPLAFNKLFGLDAPTTPASSGVPSSGVNTNAVVAPATKPSSGYWESKSNKEQVLAYTKRLKELGA